MRITAPLPFAAISLFALFLLAPHPAHAANITIQMTGSNTFTPRDVAINPGDTVTWVNSSQTQHTATADSGAFDSGVVQPGQSFSVTFNAAGNYAYYCKFHGAPGGRGMAGTITVANPAAPNPPPPAPSPAPAPASNPYVPPSSSASLSTQAQSLLAQIAVLQAQIGAARGAAAYDSSSCPQIGGTLKRGARGDDVARLQSFLARDASVYPEAQVIGHFGALTEKAVQRWQAKYHVVSSGSPATSGWGVVGPRTAAAIAILCTTGSYNGVAAPGPNDAPVGGFITVSPVSGAAPLTVNVVATINTTKSCLAATYRLDFGDGSSVQQIPVQSGDCRELNQTYPHTYQYGGTYTIKLSAGSHETNATVSITGPAAPPPPIFTPGLPKESFVAYPVSGGAPLTVTFAGVVNSNDQGFCTGGCVDTLDYGDGAVDTIPLPASVGGWLNYKVTHTYTQTGGFRATLYQGGAGSQQPTVGAVTIIVGDASQGGVAGAYSYQSPTVTSSGTDSLSFTVAFDLPSPCTGFTLSWSDGTSDIVQNDASGTCASAPVVRQYTHAYAAGGRYTITLKRGSNLGRVDDISLTISN